MLNKNNKENENKENESENMEDYFLTDDMRKSQNGIHFLNVFLCYYKQLFNKDSNVNMFHNVDNSEDLNSTNRCMEMLFDEMEKYKLREENDELIMLSNPEDLNPDEIKIDECDELYVLTINNKEDKICQTLLPLLMYISSMDEWEKINWCVNPLK
jgi:hypothetical protein